MWFGCHRPPEETGSPIYPSGHFEIFSASSEDGRRWACDSRTTPAFSASRDVDLFDGRFVSTPRVVAARGQQMLFYSARDCGTLYGAGDGTIVGCAVQSQGKAQPLGSVSTSELLTSPAGHSCMQSHESVHQHPLDPSSVTYPGQKSALMMVVFGNWFTQPS